MLVMFVRRWPKRYQKRRLSDSPSSLLSKVKEGTETPANKDESIKPINTDLLKVPAKVKRGDKNIKGK